MENTKITDIKQLIPNELLDDVSITKIIVEYYSSTLRLALESESDFVRKLEFLIKNLSTIFGCTIIPAEMIEEWDLQSLSLMTIFTREGAVADGRITSSKLHPGSYLIVITPIKSEENEHDAATRVKGIVACLTATLGETSAHRRLGRYIYDKEKDKLTFSSNVIRQAHAESNIVAYPLIFGEKIQNLEAADRLQESVARALGYYTKALEEQDWSLKIFLYCVALETIIGNGKKLISCFHHIYRDHSTNLHQTKQKLRMDELKKNSRRICSSRNSSKRRWRARTISPTSIL